jgi:hypothetical protein|tara:strand:+ start:687 stop:869 length:183 start_codon:yes stop_codon:yes gene_type:complete
MPYVKPSDETITGLELLMKLSPKDQKRLVSKLREGRLSIDRDPSPTSEPGGHPADEEETP